MQDNRGRIQLIFKCKFMDMGAEPFPNHVLTKTYLYKTYSGSFLIDKLPTGVVVPTNIEVGQSLGLPSPGVPGHRLQSPVGGIPVLTSCDHIFIICLDTAGLPVL